MTKRIRVMGEIEIEDHEYDPGEEGPLTAEAFDLYASQFPMDDIAFEEIKDD